MLFIKHNQKQLHAEQYIHLRDAVSNYGDGNLQDIGQQVIVPSSFIGGACYMTERQQDALACVRKYGRTDLFTTFTCSPKWVEIERELFEGQEPSDITARVFHDKQRRLITLLKTEHRDFTKIT